MTHMMKTHRLILLALTALVALASACSSGNKKDNTADAIKEQKKDELVEVLGIKRAALDAFDEANAALAKDPPDMATAQSKFEEALSISPDFLEAQFNIGVIYEANARYDKALEAYAKAQQLDKANTHSVEVIIATARTNSLKGDTDKAMTGFEEALRLDPENIAVLNGIGAVYFKAGKLDEAVEYVKKVLREDNENLTALNTLAQVYTAQDNRSMAIYVFKKAARVAIGAITNDEELNTEPAVLVLNEKVRNKELDRDLAADLFNNLGMIYLKMEETPLAVVNFRAASMLSPTHVESRLNLGAIYIQYLNYEGAQDLFNQALTAAPANCTAKLGVATSFYALGKKDDAIKDYTNFLDTCDDKDAAVHLQMQRIYEQQQDFDNAIKHCNIYVEIAKPEAGSPVTKEYCSSLAQMKEMMRNQPVAPEGGEGDAGGDMQPLDEGGDMQPLDEGGDMQPLDEGGDMQPLDEEPPAEGGDAPAEGGDAPAEGGDAPAEGGDAPAEGGDAPAEGGDAPAEGGDAAP